VANAARTSYAFRATVAVKTLVIGDIHACYAEMLDLIDRAQMTDGDEIVALGDVIDRGPDPIATLDFFLGGAGRYRITSLLGNHERKHVRSYRKQTRAALSQIITRAAIGEEHYPAVVAALDAWPRYIERPDALLVHGFLEPGVALGDQLDTVLAGTMTGARRILKRCGERWYETYNGDRPLIVGHLNYTRTSEPLVTPTVFGIDTDCCRGGALTGIVLPDFRIVSVPARRNHWVDTRARWLASQPHAQAQRFDETAPFDDETERLLCAIYDLVQAENARIVADLRGAPAEDLGKLYAARITMPELAPLLHRARRGQLTIETLRRRFRTPKNVRRFMRK